MNEFDDEEELWVLCCGDIVPESEMCLYCKYEYELELKKDN